MPANITALIRNNQIALLAVAYALVVMAIMTRLLPHSPNVTSVTAVALFAGALLPGRWSIAVVVGSLIVTDLIIGVHSLSWLVWVCFAAIALASRLSLRRIQPGRVIVASIGSSIFFYLVTNFGVWAEGRMYTLTWTGLMESYYMALPFFRNALIGDILYSGILFGVYGAVVFAVHRMQANSLSGEKIYQG